MSRVELLAPPDVEPAVVEVLSVDPWHVGTEYVDHDAGTVRVSSTGGGQPVDRVVVAANLLVECWHADETQAWDIARTAWARLAAAEGSVVAGVDLKRVVSTLPNNFPDVNRLALARYQFVTTVHTRLTALEA